MIFLVEVIFFFKNLKTMNSYTYDEERIIDLFEEMNKPKIIQHWNKHKKTYLFIFFLIVFCIQIGIILYISIIEPIYLLSI